MGGHGNVVDNGPFDNDVSDILFQWLIEPKDRLLQVTSLLCGVKMCP